ncbi:photosynthetic protein synthase II [Tenacibaculum holothuriorum]|uniref:Photosynthetic protein synthase II n=1 Tax=Tenacibaculum holothuriorum TaxID=1635173 RepID=A0A1Y2PEB8_9FLAO|nr:SCO family protein [Tenacibaculum holothuriorum]OSY88836.1 photosynthetic protein synthase II [Tenacibaculum holothuriorum]
MKKSKYSYVGISFIVLLFGIYSVPKIIKHFKKADLHTFNKVPDFEFINQNGKTITNKDYDGKVYVVEFFFTTCSTICPIMNKKMVTIQNEFLGNPNFGIASFSINPDTDTPDVMKSYASHYGINHKNWNLLTGKPDDVVFKLSNDGFKLPVGIGDETHDGFYHSGMFALVDKDGNLRSRYDEHGNPIAFYRALDEHGLSDQIQELKEDIKLLLNE